MHERTTAPKAAAVTCTPGKRLSAQRSLAGGKQQGWAGKATTDSQSLAIRRESDSHSHPSTAPPVVHEVLRSSGEPLDMATRSFMESRFGHDFSRVRLHTGEKAAASAAGVNALAYTVGQDIVFGAGQYAPNSREGQKVLAHELAHTVQQSGEAQGVPAKLEITDSNDAAEKEAEAAANSVMAGESFGPTEGHDARLARQDPTAPTAPTTPAPVPASPPPATKKSVTVNVTYLSGGSTNLSAHLTKANEVFKQANVEVKSGKEVTLDEAKSKAILGDDLILHEYSSPTTPTTEEQALLKENRTSGTITMYYVKGMSAGSLGEAFWTATGQPESFVYASSNSRTWPHELGHVLLDTGSHPSDADNFMAQTSVASGKELMTDAQIKTIQASSFVK